MSDNQTETFDWNRELNLINESEVNKMPKSLRKRAGAKYSVILLSIFLFLLLFAQAASAATYGDINDDGEINVQDVALVMRHVLDIEELTEAQEAVADVNGDGNINVQDVTLIMQHALGLIDDFPHAALAVSKVTAVNPKQVEVEFNRILNATEMEDMVLENFHVGLQASPATNRLTGTGAAVSLNGDNKTLILTMGGDNVFVNGSTTNRVIVKKEVGIAADYTNSSVAFTDNAVPTLVDVKSVSPSLIVLTFSEPLDKSIIPTNITLNDGAIALNLNGATYVDSQRELRINTYSNLSSGTHTLAIKSGTSLKDYTGYSVVPVSKTFTHTPITTAPTISVKSSNERSVTIEFSREIDTDSLVGNTSVLFRHTYDSTVNQVTGADVTNPSGDSKTFVINFDDKLLPPGTTTMWMKYATDTVDADKVKDTWGNTIAPATFSVTTTADTTAPTASVSVYNNTRIDVQYSEPVTGGDNLGNYTLKKGTTTVTISSIVDLGNNKYRLVVSNEMQGVHTLTIANIKDKSPAENAMGTQTYTFDVDDKIPPKVVDLDGAENNNFYWQTTAGNSDEVRIFFSEPMNASDLVNKQMYENMGSGNANPTTATAASDGKSVYLKFANNVTGKLRVGSLRDVAGNSLGISTELSGENYYVGLDGSVTDPARAITTTSIRLYLNEIITAESYEDFEISVDGGLNWDEVAFNGISNVTTSGKSVITLYLASADAIGYDADDVEVRTVASPSSENLFGISLEIPETAVEDKIPPVLVKAEVDSTTQITLTFSEDLDEDSFALTGRNGFSVSGTTISTAIPHNTDADKVVITRSSGSFFVAGSSTVSYSASTGEVADENGNALATFTNRATE